MQDGDGHTARDYLAILALTAAAALLSLPRAAAPFNFYKPWHTANLDNEAFWNESHTGGCSIHKLPPVPSVSGVVRVPQTHFEDGLACGTCMEIYPTTEGPLDAEALHHMLVVDGCEGCPENLLTVMPFAAVKSSTRAHATQEASWRFVPCPGLANDNVSIYASFPTRATNYYFVVSFMNAAVPVKHMRMYHPRLASWFNAERNNGAFTVSFADHVGSLDEAKMSPPIRIDAVSIMNESLVTTIPGFVEPNHPNDPLSLNSQFQKQERHPGMTFEERKWLCEHKVGGIYGLSGNCCPAGRCGDKCGGAFCEDTEGGRDECCDYEVILKPACDGEHTPPCRITEALMPTLNVTFNRACTALGGTFGQGGLNATRACCPSEICSECATGERCTGMEPECCVEEIEKYAERCEDRGAPPCTMRNVDLVRAALVDGNGGEPPPVDDITKPANISLRSDAFSAADRTTLCTRLGGIADDRATVCCSAKCASCDRQTCETDSECCPDMLRAHGTDCSNASAVPCRMDEASKDAFAESAWEICQHKLGGLSDGEDACCPSDCGQCGGMDCGSLPGGTAVCCSTGIHASNASSCDIDHEPPCLVTAATFFSVKADVAPVYEREVLCRRHLDGSYDRDTGVCCKRGALGSIDCSTNETTTAMAAMAACSSGSNGNGTPALPCVLTERPDMSIKDRWTKRRVCEDYIGGVFNEAREVCCPIECEECGGEGCSLRADSRPDKCCSKEIRAAGSDLYCSKLEVAPCAVDDESVTMMETHRASGRNRPVTTASIAATPMEEISNAAVCAQQLGGKFDVTHQVCCPKSCDNCGADADQCSPTTPELCCPDYEMLPACAPDGSASELPCRFTVDPQAYCTEIANGVFNKEWSACSASICGARDDAEGEACESGDEEMRELCCPWHIRSVGPSCADTRHAPCALVEPFLLESDIVTVMATHTRGRLSARSQQVHQVETITPDLKAHFSAASASLDGGVRALAGGRRMYVGFAVTSPRQLTDPTYVQTLAEESNLLPTSAQCTMGVLQPQQGVFDFSLCDRMADLSTELSLKMRMPLVTWGRGVLGWASKDHHRREAALLTHVREVVGRYADADAMPHVIQMDVAADVLSNVQKDPQNSPVLHGPSGWVERAFKAAREAAGNAPIRLMISDHHIESSKGVRGMRGTYTFPCVCVCVQGKGEAMYQYLRFLKEKGAPVNGVAMQMRVALHGTDFDSVSRQVRRIGRLGMEVHMTQLEVSCGKSATCRQLHGRNELAFQEQVEVSMLLTRICLEEPNCTTVTMGGVSVSWLDKGQRSHRSLLLSGSSYVGVRKALMGA